MIEDLFDGLRTMMTQSGPAPATASVPTPAKPKVGRPDRGDRRKVKAGRKARRR